MPSKVSFEERKIIFVVEVCGPEVLEDVWSSDARLRGGFSAKVLLLPKWGCGSPQNWKQSGSLNSWERKSVLHIPCSLSPAFFPGPVKGP